MSAALPAQLDPWQAVAREAAFAGSLALSDLPRLRDLLVGAVLARSAPATFEIAFRRDEAGRAVVVGRVRAVLPLTCQRCLKVVEHGVDAAIRLMLTDGTGLAEEPPETYEALPVVGDRVRPAEMIEDELLLSLPQIPRHPFGVCQAAAQSSPAQPVDDGQAAADLAGDRPKPFGVLAGWKVDRHKAKST